MTKEGTDVTATKASRARQHVGKQSELNQEAGERCSRQTKTSRKEYRQQQASNGCQQKDEREALMVVGGLKDSGGQSVSSPYPNSAKKCQIDFRRCGNLARRPAS